MDMIKSGTVLIENGTLLPKSVVLSREAYSKGWASVANSRLDLEKDIRDAGWTFFFLAGAIHSNVFGFNAETAVHTAVERLIQDARALNCNCLQIGEVTMKSFLGLPFASVSAHSRHIQRERVFAG